MPRLMPRVRVLERDRSGIARAQRLTMLLERDPRFSDIPNFAATLKALSPAPNKIDIALSNSKNVKGGNFPTKAALMAAALSGFNEKNMNDPSVRQNYRTLRKMQLQSPKPKAQRGGQSYIPPLGGDKRRYDPTGKDHAYTVYGTAARIISKNGWLPVFAAPNQVMPCIQRKVRRQVMFANGKAGRAYRVYHRRTWQSGVPC